MLTFRVPAYTEQEKNCIAKIAKHTGLTRQAASLLYNRGIHEVEQADAFLQGNVFHDPFFLEHMEQAVDCIEQALSEKSTLRCMGIMTATVCAVVPFWRLCWSRQALRYPSLYQIGRRMDTA